MMRHVTTVFADMDGLVSDVWETNPLFFFFYQHRDIAAVFFTDYLR
jgi:hypothetical protein